MSEEIISKKFREWTEGLDPVAARISVFEHLRDIPYEIVRGFQPEEAAEELLKQDKGACYAKHEVLSQMFEEMGIETKYVSYIFKWDDPCIEYPPELQELAKQMPICDHIFCEAFIDGKWVKIDATWDLSLEKAGFPVNKAWDGYSDTNAAVVPIQESRHADLESWREQKGEMVKKYTEDERATGPKFYPKLNEWMRSMREDRGVQRETRCDFSEKLIR